MLTDIDTADANGANRKAVESMLTGLQSTYIVIIIIIIIIIITLKGAIWDYYNLLTVPRTVSNTQAPVATAHSCANHVQRIQPLSNAICVPHSMKVQLSY